MKILVLAPQPFFQNRGTPIAVRLLVEVLGANGNEVHLLVFHEGEDVELNNVTIHRIAAIPGLHSIGPGFSIKKIICDGFLWLKCIQLQRTIRFDYVHAVEESVFIALVNKLFFKVPYVYDIDSWLSEQLLEKLSFLKPLRGLFEFFETIAIKGSIGTIPVCLALEEKVKRIDDHKPLVRLEDISLLNENNNHEEELLKSDHGIDGDIILYVGNLEKYQGIDLLLESFALLSCDKSKCGLVIIGGADGDIEKYRQKSEKLGILKGVFFLGPRPVTKLGMYLRQADILVSPRIEGENTPMKIYSYMDSGKPVVATKIKSHTQVLNDTISVLVDPNPESMARGMNELLGDQVKAIEIAKKAKQKVAADFSRAAFEKKLTGFYTELENVRNLRL